MNEEDLNGFGGFFGMTVLNVGATKGMLGN